MLQASGAFRGEAQTVKVERNPGNKRGEAGEDCARSLSRLTCGQHNPETNIAVREGRTADAAVRRPAVPGAAEIAVIGAAANHVIQARSWPLRVNGNPAGIGVEPVLAPFKDIPVHVIQSPRIGQLLPHRMRRSAAVASITCVGRQVRVARVIPIAEPRWASPCRWFPQRRQRWPAGRC